MNMEVPSCHFAVPGHNYTERTQVFESGGKKSITFMENDMHMLYDNNGGFLETHCFPKCSLPSNHNQGNLTVS